MLKNHFKIAWRNLLKNKISSLINIGGLAIGMAVALLIGLWTYDELSFNRSFQNYDRIAQVLVRHIDQGEIDVNRSMPIPLGIRLRSDYGSDFKQVVMSTPTEDYILSAGNKTFIEQGRYMQPETPDMFTLNMLHGSRPGLIDPHSILLSASLAKTLFGNADPMNKILQIDNKSAVKVTGVYKDMQDNTFLNDVSFILPWDLLISSNTWYNRRMVDWTDNFLIIYVQLAPHASLAKVSGKIKNEKLNHISREQKLADNPEVFLHPMSQWHLDSKFENGVQVTSQQLRYVWLYGIIGIFVLLLACINFMNLSTARSEKRAKEVGIRKVMGSLRRQLLGQFFGESVLVAAFSFGLSMVLVLLILPWFNVVADKKVQLPWTSPLFWLMGLGFTFITGMIAGSYPALYLSSFKPVKVLKGTFRVGRLASLPRKALVVIQFTVSIILVIGTVVVYRQIQFSKNRPVGYSREGLIYINMKTDDIHKQHEAFRDDLLKTGAVTEMAESNGTVNELWSNNGGFSWNGKDPNVPDKIYFGTIGVTSEFGKTAGWQFVRGRDFSKSFPSDSNAFVINEAAIKYMGLKNPVGEIIQRDGQNHRIIGVIKDVLMGSPYEPVTPTVFFLGTWKYATVSIRIQQAISVLDALAKIETVFKKYAPAMPFDFKFADSEYAKKFATEDRIGRLAGFFAMLAILISCSGLFGLASYVTEQRFKEIGIRKVLGASVASLWKMLSVDFLVLVIISCLIAIPVACHFLHGWLQQYAYHAKISWWIFAETVAGALVITLVTVSFRSVKAAIANPVRSLRTE